MDVTTGRRQVQVMTKGGGKVFKYTFERDGDDLYLQSRQEASDPGAGGIPNYTQGPMEVSGSVRSELNSRGFSVHTSGSPSNSGSVGLF